MADYECSVPVGTDQYLVFNALDKTKQQLRLVSIQPDPPEAPILCSLKTTDLRFFPIYEALSYEWGKLESGRRQIMLDGRPFMVRENLWWALLHVRHESQEKIIWIDALCINQNDNQERNHQVGLMGSIFRNAAIVRAWLGCEKDGSEEGFQAVREFYRLHSGGDSWKIGGTKYLLRMSESARWCLSRLLRKTYWSRIWIVQELLLARGIIIHCGDDELQWAVWKFCLHELLAERVDKAPNVEAEVPLYLAAELPSNVLSANDSTSPAERLASQRLRERRSLLSLVNTCANFEASDPRDKIFALLGIANDVYGSIPVDYNCSVGELKAIVAVHFQVTYYDASLSKVPRHHLPSDPSLLLEQIFPGEKFAFTNRVHTIASKLAQEREISKYEFEYFVSGYW